jgi:hypothetical protein
MKKTLFYTDKEKAIFTFLTQWTKRNYISKQTQPIASYWPYSLGRGFATNKQPYNEEMRILYINFIKALLHNKLNLHKSKFNNYGEIIKFLEEFQGDKLFSKPYISKLKSEGQFERVPLTDKSEEFIHYIKIKFPNFNDARFVYRNSGLNTSVKLNNQPTTPSPTYIPKIWELGKKGGYSFKSPKFNFKYYSVNTQALLRHFFTFIAFLFLMLPYSILLLLAIKQGSNPSELFTLIKEFNTDLDIENVNSNPNSYKFRDFYNSTSDLTPKEIYYQDNEVIPQRGSYNTPGSLEFDYLSDKAKLDKTIYSKSSWFFPMLDFYNLKYFPSLFQDFSYTIVNDTLSCAKERFSNISTSPVTYNSFSKVPSLPDKISSTHTSLVLDIPSQPTTKIDTLQKTTSSPSGTTKSFISESASSTFSKYFYFEDSTLPSAIQANSSGTTTIKTLSTQPELSEGFRTERPIHKKTVRFDKIEDNFSSSLDPEIPERLSTIEPIYPNDDMDFTSLRNDTSQGALSTLDKGTDFYKTVDSLSLDPIIPDVKTLNSPPIHPDLEFKHTSLTQLSDETSSSTRTDSISSLHKLNTDFNLTGSSQVHLHDELFKKKVLIEEKNNLISELEINNINLDFRIATIEKESSNLVKQKLELTKQFNINNIKAVDPIPSSIFDKYKDAYLSISTKNHEITFKVREIKEKLDFLEKTKLDLLKDINNNIKNIANFKKDKAFLIKEVHDIEKITGNISRTPLH